MDLSRKTLERTNSSDSTWLGRYQFSRSVFRRIEARNIPDLCFPRSKAGFLIDSSPSRPSSDGDGVKKAYSGPLSSHCVLKDFVQAAKQHHHQPSSSPLNPDHVCYNSEYSQSTSSNRSSPFASPARADFFVNNHNNNINSNSFPKRVQSWSQYLETTGEVKAVEKAEEWIVDMSQLFLGHKFACGAHSRLYHGIYKGKAVAVKVLRQPDEDEDTSRMIERQFLQEVSLLSRLHHRNIVQFVAACKKSPVFCIITEYLSGGSLKGFLHKNEPGTLPLKISLGMAIDVAKGMEYIHSQDVIHADLKSENLVLDDDMCVKITDFGVARNQSEIDINRRHRRHRSSRTSATTTTATCDDIGTYRWMAPEMISRKCASKQSDVYSYGIVLWELVTGMVPFHDMTSVQAAFAVVHKNARPAVPEDCPVVLKELMQRCWAVNPEKRPSFGEIVKSLEQWEESIKNLGFDTWHCPSDRTSYFLRCFSRCKKCTPVKCNCH